MEFTIDINHNANVILYKHTGFLRKEDIGEAWQEFLKLKEFTELKYNLLSDYSEAKSDLQVEDVHSITDILFSIKEILKDKKQALIVADPHSAAISFLFEKHVMERVGFNVQVFSTKEAALKWLST